MQQAYCSPARFRLGGFGIDTSGFTNAQLRQKLVQASGLVDIWTNRTLVPERADLRGGAISGEQHTWYPPDALSDRPGSRRVYLNAGPVRNVTGFSIQYTTTYEITLPPDNLYVNAQAGYIEIIASQPTIIGFPPLGYWFGLSQPVSRTDYTYGWQFAVTDDPCEAESPTLYVASHGNWLPGGTPTITVAGVVIDPTDYTLNLDDGSIAFASTAQPDPDQEVLASYVYVLPDAVATATGVIATAAMAESRIAARGLLGLQSLRVAEVALTVMSPSQRTVQRNGVSIPEAAASLLLPFALGSTS